MEQNRRSNIELKELAIDIYDRKVLTNSHFDSLEDLSSVFIPLALGAFNDYTEEQVEDIGLIYEYYDKSQGTSGRGLPVFWSFKVLSKEEAQVMNAFYKEYKELKETFLAT